MGQTSPFYQHAARPQFSTKSLRMARPDRDTKIAAFGSVCQDPAPVRRLKLTSVDAEGFVRREGHLCDAKPLR